WLELTAIRLQRRDQRRRREMRRERIRQPENAGQLRAEQTRAKNPEGHLESCTWHGLHLLAWRGWFEKLLQLHHIIGKTIGAHWIAPQRQQRALIRSRCSPKSEVDSSRINHFKSA